MLRLERVPEVSTHDAGEELAILDQERLVQAELVTDLFHRLGGGGSAVPGAQEQDGRVARDEVEGREDQRENKQGEPHSHRDSLKNEGQHGSASYSPLTDVSATV